MLYTIPDYYREFHCTADDCEDTCCAGWKIVIDDKSRKKYKKVKGAAKKRLRASIDWKESVFHQDQELRCAFLDEQNLCDLYKELGEKALCRTCRLYPRHIEEFEGVREISLSVSCPEVAKILMKRQKPVRFLSVEKKGEETYQDYDPFLYSQLVDARDVSIGILQDRSMSMEVRIQLVLGIAHDMQHRINHQELFACQEVLERYQKPEARAFVEQKTKERSTGERYLFFRKMFVIAEQMETLKTDWKIHLMECRKRLYQGDDDKAWAELSTKFTLWIGKWEHSWEVQKEQLMVYFVFTYFCGAVYDGNAYGKMKLAAASVFLIEEMLKARWERNEESIDMEDVIEIVYRYSREIEHSDGNLKYMEKLLDKERFC